MYNNIKKMKSSLNLAKDFLVLLMDWIDKEHEFLSSRKIKEAQEAALGKVQASKNFIKEQENLRDAMEKFCHQINKVSSNSSLKEMMEEIRSFQGTSKENQAIEDFCDQMEDLLAVTAKSQSRLRCNRLVLERFISHYQKSECFWAHLASEYENTYNQKGGRSTRESSRRLSQQV